MSALQVQKAVDHLKSQDNTVNAPKLFNMMLAFLAERADGDDIDDAIAHVNEYQHGLWVERDRRNESNRARLAS